MYRFRRKYVLEKKLDKNKKEVEDLSQKMAAKLDKIMDLELDLEEWERGY